MTRYEYVLFVWLATLTVLFMMNLKETTTMQIQIKPMPTSAEFAALAEEYHEKFLASGQEEHGPDYQRRHLMIVAALRSASSLRALAELPPSP